MASGRCPKILGKWFSNANVNDIFPMNNYGLDANVPRSTLVEVMTWCCQATSHNLSQCWPTYVSPYGVTRSQWGNVYFWEIMLISLENICNETFHFQYFHQNLQVIFFFLSLTKTTLDGSQPFRVRMSIIARDQRWRVNLPKQSHWYGGPHIESFN